MCPRPPGVRGEVKVRRALRRTSRAIARVQSGPVFAQGVGHLVGQVAQVYLRVRLRSDATSTPVTVAKRRRSSASASRSNESATTSRKSWLTRAVRGWRVRTALAPTTAPLHPPSVSALRTWDLALLEGLDHVAVFQVLEVGEADPALEARLHLAHVVFEPAQRVDGPLPDDDAVVQEPHLRTPGDGNRRVRSSRRRRRPAALGTPPGPRPRRSRSPRTPGRSWPTMAASMSSMSL